MTGRASGAGSDLPADVLDLIARHLDSMAQVEVLLFLHTGRAQGWQAYQVAQELRIQTPAAAEHLETLASNRLATSDDATPASYRYDPATPALGEAVENLRVAYNTRPVTLVNALYARPARAIRSFADAFRIRPPGDK